MLSHADEPSMLLPYLHSTYFMPDRLMNRHGDAAVAQEANRRLELMEYLDGLIKIVRESHLSGKGFVGTHARL